MPGELGMHKGMLRPAINIGCQAVFKLVFAIVSLKVVAYFAGPSGMAIVGQLQAFFQILSSGVSSVTTTGVVKLIAEDRYSKEKVLQSSLVLLFFLSLTCLAVLIISGRSISDLFLQGSWVGVLVALPVAAFFVGLNNLYVSYFNGSQKYREYLWYSIITAFLIAVLTCFISFMFGKTGALYSIALAPIFAGLLMLLLPSDFRLPQLKLIAFDLDIIKILLSYSMMALGSVVVVYGVQIALRDYIATNSSIEQSGIWYSATRLSDIYMGICSVLFSTLLLPKYSSHDGRELSSMVWRLGSLSVVFVLVMVLSVNQLASFIVGIIYGDEFSVSAEILQIYVLGDALKCLSWVFLYVMIAKQHVRIYLLYEIFTAAMYLFFCIFFYQFYGFENMAYGYPLQGVISLVMVLVWFLLSRRKSAKLESKFHDAV